MCIRDRLSRAPTGRANHRPMLSDIRESGASEQDADVVIDVYKRQNVVCGCRRHLRKG